MALIEVAKKILNEYDYKFEVLPHRAFLRFGKGKKIEIKKQFTEEQFFKVFSRFNELLGSPICVHSYYGFIWEKNGEFIAFNTIEENYGCDITAIFVLSKIPFGKNVSFNEYSQIEEIVKQVFLERNLNCNRFMHYCDGNFSFFGDSDDLQYLLILKQKSLEFYCSTKEPMEDGKVKMMPLYFRKERILLSDLPNLSDIIQKCFIQNV